jgi:hypothetical protein
MKACTKNWPHSLYRWNFGDRWIKCYKQTIAVVLWENLFKRHCPPQIPYGLTRGQTEASAVKDRRISALAIHVQKLLDYFRVATTRNVQLTMGGTMKIYVVHTEGNFNSLHTAREVPHCFVFPTSVMGQMHIRNRTLVSSEAVSRTCYSVWHTHSLLVLTTWIWLFDLHVLEFRNLKLHMERYLDAGSTYPKACHTLQHDKTK